MEPEKLPSVEDIFQRVMELHGMEYKKDLADYLDVDNTILSSKLGSTWLHMRVFMKLL